MEAKLAKRMEAQEFLFNGEKVKNVIMRKKKYYIKSYDGMYESYKIWRLIVTFNDGSKDVFQSPRVSRVLEGNLVAIRKYVDCVNN